MRRNMPSLISFLCLICLAFAAGVSSASAQKRVALVVGMSAYQHVHTLVNPANDARLMAGTLRSLGWVLVGGGPQLNPDKPALDRLVQTFGREAQGADAALLYYSGHGMQVDGANYLIPVDAGPTTSANPLAQLVDVKAVLRQLQDSGARVKMVIFDACRNNPLGLHGAEQGLAEMQASGPGMIIGFATQPGNTAADAAYPGASNGPYALALARVLREGRVELFSAFRRVALAVMDATGSKQQPWFNASPIRGDFYFAVEQQIVGPPPVDLQPISLPALGNNYAFADKPSEFTAELLRPMEPLRDGEQVNYTWVKFKAGVTTDAVVGFLRKYRANLIAGPDKEGYYRIRYPDPTLRPMMEEIQSGQSVDQFLQSPLRLLESPFDKMMRESIVQKDYLAPLRKD